ncbi:MAG: FG-GAP-like repeat-containing protein [Verrucomicrobiales bacterium]
MTTRRQLLVWVAAALCIGLGIALIIPRLRKKQPQLEGEDFVSLVLRGRSALENAQSGPAIEAFRKALAIEPTQPDVHLNLANALLLADEKEAAIAQAQEVLKLERNSAAALYVIGCAKLRLGQAEDALKALQQSEFIDAAVSAVHFQIGRACQALGQWEEAASAFSTAINLEPEHPAAHYALSQVLIRLDQPQPAQEEIKRHQEIMAKRPNLPSDPTFFEKCKHTMARLPKVKPEQPAATGVKVVFFDVTGDQGLAGKRGPFGIVDLQRDGRRSLLVVDPVEGLCVLENRDGRLVKLKEPLPGLAGARYRQCLVADLNNDQLDDVLMLSDQGAKVFALGKDGNFTDATDASGLRELRASAAVLADLDFTGKLGLIAIDAGKLAFFRNQGGLVFRALPAASVVPNAPADVRQILVDDWNGDDLPDLFLVRDAEAPQLWLNQHGGPLKLAAPTVPRLDPTIDVSENATSAETPSPPWPAGGSIAVGDVNDDLRHDLLVATGSGIEIVFGGLPSRATIPLPTFTITRLALVDYDNDGWLDIFALGSGLRAWRNLGHTHFHEVTSELGLDTFGNDPVTSLTAADLDADGDSDLLLDRGESGLQSLRNDGGNGNRQLKIRLLGKRSNANGFGARVELIAGGWRASRTVGSRPLEIGVGQRARLDSFSVHWADLVMNLGAMAVDAKTPIEVTELEFPTGSCPYLYTWDGTRFRFVTDLLGASPAGLRISDDRFIDADTDELVHIGDESLVSPREGNYTLQITSELREITYLDQAQLIVADHPPGTELFSTSKLRPGKPFPPHEIVLLHHRRPLLRAIRNDGFDVTSTLAGKDGEVVSPIRLRVPQLRGLAEPFTVTLDFGPLPADRPLALALTGWLRFGGGMTNVAASHDPTLPFPFPTLEAEIEGRWQSVDVICGAPAGKTKSIVVDLTGKLPTNTSRLRLTTAFEIHWDRIALFERADAPVRSVTLASATADLHWHGTSQYESKPWTVPLTPIYEQVQAAAPWLITPSGWCTRYGDVRELVAKRDDALVILNCGDEVTLTFPAAQLPPKSPGHQREFFLFSSGWDKDGDYHVERGLTVEPLPFQGMDDQLYGRHPRPVIEGDWWIPKYNRRWVGPLALRKNTPGDH